MSHIAGKKTNKLNKAGNMKPTHLNKQKSQPVIVRDLQTCSVCPGIFLSVPINTRVYFCALIDTPDERQCTQRCHFKKQHGTTSQEFRRGQDNTFEKAITHSRRHLQNTSAE